MKKDECTGWVYHDGDFWLVVEELVRDRYRIKLGRKEKTVSVEQLMKEIPQ